MPAHWYLFQYTKDMRRHEPRNFGLALHAEGRWHFHFLGEDADGKINGRRIRGLGVDKSLYEAWVGYFRRKALEGDWDTALSLYQRRPSNFSVRPGGVLLEESPMWDVTAYTMYQELVSEPRASRTIIDDALDLFRQIDVEPDRDIVLPGRWSEESPQDDVHFTFGVGGTRVPVEALTEQSQSMQALRGRIDAVSRVKRPGTIIAMLRRDPSQEDRMEPLIKSIERDAHIVDIAGEEPAQQLGEALSLA